MTGAPLFLPRRRLSPRRHAALGFAAFALPLLLWCAVSYLPFVWHPLVLVTEPGDVDYFQPGMRTERAQFEEERAAVRERGGREPAGVAANPVYLPAPHDVALAFVHSLRADPSRADGPRLHESMGQSIALIAASFALSSALALPLGILAGTFTGVSRLSEPFIEFFRYLPAPAFGALAVAVLGIYDGPKVAVIVIGTFFQQVLVVADTARKLDYALLEAALTLGTRGVRLVTHVVVPGILPDLYRAQRILLGWAWTYLVVAELVGTSSGITLFITQQARFQHFDNVYAAILLIGFVGFGCDLLLERLGRRLFPWDRGATHD